MTVIDNSTPTNVSHLGERPGADVRPGREMTRRTRTLLACEWLQPHGGAENVFEQMAEAMPEAKLRCLWNDAPERFGEAVDESWLARTPMRRHKAAALPLISAASRSVRAEDFDQVIVASHSFAHHLASKAARRGVPAFAYIHSPARYVWVPEFDSRGRGKVARAASKILQCHDRRNVSQDVSYAANSRFVQQRINAAWDQEAQVIYPPVAIDRLQSKVDWRAEVTGDEQKILDGLPSEFVLGASRLVAYKRQDLTMRVGEALGLPVVIAGSGPHRAALEEMAKDSQVPVHFVGRVSDNLLYALYQRASMFAFMAIEDFGIMPVEAMALGTPVLVNRIGGAAESVTMLQGGEVVSDSAGRDELRAAAERALQVDTHAVRIKSRVFSEHEFRSNIHAWTAAG